MTLQEKFPEFYQKKLIESDLGIESNNLIVLDSNFLLDVIQLPTDVAQKYIDALEKVKKNIYIPYLVALEFNFRKSGIKKEKHHSIQKYKKRIQNSIKSLEENILDYSAINIQEKSEEFSGQMLKQTDEFKTELLKTLDEKIGIAITEEEQNIYNNLIGIIESKIGEKYEQSWIDTVQEEGKDRYEKRLPPGFNDDGKGEEEENIRRYDGLTYERKFGDLIIWQDIINYSKNKTNKNKKVVFVTNDGLSDKKQDLYYKVKNLTVGPHIFLMNELQMEAGKELYIVSNLRFIQLATNLSDEQMKEIESLSEPLYKIKIPKEERKNVLEHILKYNAENSEGRLWLTDEGYLYKEDEKRISNEDDFYLSNSSSNRVNKICLNDDEIEQLQLNNDINNRLKDMYSSKEFSDLSKKIHSMKLDKYLSDDVKDFYRDKVFNDKINEISKQYRKYLLEKEKNEELDD